MSQHRPTPLLVDELETKLMFAIELDIVALHEFGHALSLAHYADTAANSIMEAFYNSSYNKNNLATYWPIATIRREPTITVLQATPISPARRLGSTATR